MTDRLNMMKGISGFDLRASCTVFSFINHSTDRIISLTFHPPPGIISHDGHVMINTTYG